MTFFSSLIPTGGREASQLEEGVAQSRKPYFQVRETDQAFDLTVNLPGVDKAGVEITDEDGELTITGKRSSGIPQGAEVLHRESSDAPYKLVLSHDGTVDTAKIGAELRDGVLRLSLAKAESAKPRKIQVS